MIDIGLDTGINGCIGVLKDGAPLDHFSFKGYAVINKKAAKGASKKLDIDRLITDLSKFLAKYPDIRSITIEMSGGYRPPPKKNQQKEDRPAFSVDSIYKLGFNSAIPEVILCLLYPLVVKCHVHPNTWKAAIGIGKLPKGTDKKKMSLKFAREMEGWQEYAAKHLTRVLDHDRAESLLIAKYGHDKARVELF